MKKSKFKTINNVSHCSTKVNSLTNLMKKEDLIETKEDAKLELDECKREILKLNYKLDSISSKFAIDTPLLTNLVIYNPCKSNKPLKEFMKELEKSFDKDNFELKKLINVESKYQNWNKRRFWE